MFLEMENARIYRRVEENANKQNVIFSFSGQGSKACDISIAL